jgi:phage-related protein
LLDVDGVRFGALTTEEEKAVPMNAKDFWHTGFLSFAWAKPKGSRRCR